MQKGINVRYLDNDEQEIIKSFNKGEWISDKKTDKKLYIKAAKKYLDLLHRRILNNKVKPGEKQSI